MAFRPGGGVAVTSSVAGQGPLPFANDFYLTGRASWEQRSGSGSAGAEFGVGYGDNYGTATLTFSTSTGSATAAALSVIRTW